MSNSHWIIAFLLVAACATPRPADTAAAPHPVSADTVIYVMKLQHVQADEIAPRIHDILNPASRTAETVRSAPDTGAGSTAGQDVVRIAVAPGQNALVLSGPPARILEARDAIERLDVAVDPATRR